MINLSRIIHSPAFARDITIERTSGGHFEGPKYVSVKKILTLRGIVVNPKSSKEIQQTEQGDQAEGYVNIYVDGSVGLFTTRKRLDRQNNISDVYIENYGTPYETRYRITNVTNRTKWGFVEAQASREGAI